MTALPANTLVPAPADIAAARERFGARIKERLGKPSLTVLDARDGIRDCFLSTYMGGIEAGVKALNLRPEPHHLEAIADQILKRRLKTQGVSWDAPTVDALERVKQETDAELHFDQLPAELHALHDQICSLLLAKVSGLMPHRGDTSVVTRAARHQDEVEQAMRRTIAAFLTQFREAAEHEEAPELLGRMGKLSRLIETLQAIQ